MIELVYGLGMVAFALIVPGYFLTLGVFPAKKDIDGIERITFSLVFSLTFLPLAMLIENQLIGIPIEFFSVFSTMLVLIIFGILMWMVRTTRLPVPAPIYRVLPKVQPEESVSLLPSALRQEP